VFFPALPAGEQPDAMKAELKSQDIARRKWPKAAEGMEATASVLKSGVSVDLSERREGDLLLVDVRSDVEQVVAHGTPRSWALSPNGRAVAFTLATSAYVPKSDAKLPFDFSGVSRIGVVQLD